MTTHHAILLTAMRDRTLTEAARTVLSYLYANTNGSLQAEIFIDEICADLGIADSTLRRHRSALAAAGYLTSARQGDVLTFTIHDPERAPSERDVDDNAHLVSAERSPSERDEPERAPSERSDPERAPSERSGADQRAPTARSLPRAERENAARPPHTPLQGIVKYAAGGSTSSTIGGSAEGGAPAANAERAQRLLVAAGVEVEAARSLGQTYGLETVARHVAGWQIARGTMRLGVGALIHRITKWPAPPVKAADMTAGVLADHVDDDDLRSWDLVVDLVDKYTVGPEWEGIIKH